MSAGANASDATEANRDDAREAVGTVPAADARPPFRFPTALLLTCAALGVVGAVLLVPANWLSTVLTNLWWAAFTELPFLFVIWRYWGTWMHYLGAVAIGVIYPISAWAWFDLGSLGLWYQVLFFTVTIASCVGATALGIRIADRLRTAGVGHRR